PIGVDGRFLLTGPSDGKIGRWNAELSIEGGQIGGRSGVVAGVNDGNGANPAGRNIRAGSDRATGWSGDQLIDAGKRRGGLIARRRLGGKFIGIDKEI